MSELTDLALGFAIFLAVIAGISGVMIGVAVIVWDWGQRRPRPDPLPVPPVTTLHAVPAPPIPLDRYPLDDADLLEIEDVRAEGRRRPRRLTVVSHRRSPDP